MTDNRARGVDVSYWQQIKLPWSEVRKQFSFVFIRASVGLSTDAMFLTHRMGAYDAGLLVGPYHYLWSSVDGRAQALYFTQIVGDRKVNGIQLPYVVDVEQKMPENVVRDFVEEVYRLTKQRCIIYTRKNLFEIIGHRLEWTKDYPLWAAQYDNISQPTALPDSWSTWEFWQHGTTAIPGYPKEIDANIFNGTYADLLQRYVFKLRWPTDYHRVTQNFGARPEYYGQWGLPGHEGIDIEAPSGTNVYACAPGVVYEVREASDGNAYGNHVRIDHENGYKTVYAHFMRSLVKLGDRVEVGQVIGLADSTGNSSASHLHLTLKQTNATLKKWTAYPSDIIDPTPYLEMSDKVIMPVLLKNILAGNLYVRKGAGTAYEIVYTLSGGETVEALDEPQIVDCLVGKQEHWLKIKTRTGVVGWSAAWYLKKA